MAELDTTKEVWKPIPMTDGLYEASSFGNVRRTPTPLKPCINHRRGGYKQLQVKSAKGSFRVCVHTLVADAFIGTRPDRHDVNHKNGRRGDNRPENLEYATRGENLLHSYRVLGRQPVRAWRGRKISDDTIREIAALITAGASAKMIALQFHIDISHVYLIRRGRTRQGITGFART